MQCYSGVKNDMWYYEVGGDTGKYTVMYIVWCDAVKQGSILMHMVLRRDVRKYTMMYPIIQ